MIRANPLDPRHPRSIDTSFAANINIQATRSLHLDLQPLNSIKIAPSAIAIDDSPTHKPTKLIAKKARSISESSSTATPSVRQKTPSVKNMNLAFSFNRMIASSSHLHCFAFIHSVRN
jgi:hypothetical protein